MIALECSAAFPTIPTILLPTPMNNLINPNFCPQLPQNLPLFHSQLLFLLQQAKDTIKRLLVHLCFLLFSLLSLSSLLVEDSTGFCNFKVNTMTPNNKNSKKEKTHHVASQM